MWPASITQILLNKTACILTSLEVIVTKIVVLGDITSRTKERREGNQNQTKIGVRETELGRSDESSLGQLDRKMKASAAT